MNSSGRYCFETAISAKSVCVNSALTAGSIGAVALASFGVSSLNCRSNCWVANFLTSSRSTLSSLTFSACSSNLTSSSSFRPYNKAIDFKVSSERLISVAGTKDWAKSSFKYSISRSTSTESTRFLAGLAVIFTCEFLSNVSFFTVKTSSSDLVTSLALAYVRSGLTNSCFNSSYWVCPNESAKSMLKRSSLKKASALKGACNS